MSIRMKVNIGFFILCCIFFAAQRTIAYSLGLPGGYASFSSPDTSAQKPASRLYTIQVAYVTDPEEAKKRAKQLSQRIFLPVCIKRTAQNYYVILAGKAERRSDLSESESIIRANGYPQASVVNDPYGAIPVIMEILPDQTNARPPISKNTPERADDSAAFYAIRVAHITNREEAEKRAKHISHTFGIRTRIKEDGNYSLLLAGVAGKRSDLQRDIDMLRKNGYPQATIINNHRAKPQEATENSPHIAVTKERQSNLLSIVRKTHYGEDDYGVFDEMDAPHYSIEGMGVSDEGGNGRENEDIVRAWDYYRSGDYAQALELFHRVLSYSETVLEAKLGKACCFVMQNDSTKAVPLLNELKEKNYALEKLADAFFRTGQFDEALELCDTMLFFDPSNREVLCLKLNILVQTWQFREARMILAHMPKENDTLKTLQLRADLEFWLGNYGSAIVLYQDLISRWPENGDIWFGYFKALSSAQEWSLLSKAIKEGIDKIEMSDDRRDFLVEMYLSLEETEKALCLWRGMEVASERWRKTLFAIVNTLTANKKREAAVQVLKQALEMDGANSLIAGELSLQYASMDMPENGMEILRQFENTPETSSALNIAKAGLFSIVKNYETALSMLQAFEQNTGNDYKAQLIELECYYGLEDYEALIEKSASLLQKWGADESFPKSRVSALRILSQIKVGLHREAEREIGVLLETQKEKYTAAMLSVLLYAYKGVELLAALENADYGSAVFSISLFASSGQMEEHYQSIQALGASLAESSSWFDTMPQQFFEDELFFDASKVTALRMLHAWKIADELSGHNNADITEQLAMAEYRAGNFQEALEVYEQLYCMREDASYKLGMMECFMAMNNKKKAKEVCDEIQLSNLPRQEMPRYLENVVKCGIEREAFYRIIMELPEDLTKNTRVITAIAMANIHYGDYFLANNIVTEYLLNNQISLSLFQLIMDKAGDFDKGREGKHYQFAKNWLNDAVELYPENTGIQYQYARFLALHEEYEMAKKQFLAMWESNSRDTRAMIWMGKLNRQMHEFEESQKWYGLYLKTRPSDAIARREREFINHCALRKKQSDMVFAMVSQRMPGDYSGCWEWEAKRSEINETQESMFLQDAFTMNYRGKSHFFPYLEPVAFYGESGGGREGLRHEMPEQDAGAMGYSFDQTTGKWKQGTSIVFQGCNGAKGGSGNGDFLLPLSGRVNRYLAMDLPASMDHALSVEDKVMYFRKFGRATTDRLMATSHKDFKESLQNYVMGKIVPYQGEDKKGERFEIIRDGGINDIFDVSLRCDKEGMRKGFYALPPGELKNISAVGCIPDFCIFHTFCFYKEL
ncbi:MAG: tetratricopeptide repeat protein [Candidatus Kuenenia sp.]|uniref:tetratricopeptide repeat protein n=1 Tax=Candidatus Kuenenia sp. TaxID=2499824 RepID=UPI0022C00565|nr:tetratricopeptide repeat protein [Candidatus Kuenenia sp.]MCZ7622288.1 tetratricopeptide repeat protein [Candidatus Kuenenia sp.]